MSNLSDTDKYKKYITELIERLNKLDEYPWWVLIDYRPPNSPLTEGVYTGKLNPACFFIKEYNKEKCEDSHEELVRTTMGEAGRYEANGKEKVHSLSCWADMTCITCTVATRNGKRAWVLGLRPNTDKDIENIATIVAVESTSKLGTDWESKKASLEQKLIGELEKIPLMKVETAKKAKKIVERYVNKIEKLNLDVDFRELEMQAGGRREDDFTGGTSRPGNGGSADNQDPFEIPLDAVNKLSRKELTELYKRVYQEKRGVIEKKFEEDECISKLICYKEGGLVKFGCIETGENFRTARKQLQERLGKYCYVFSRPVFHEEMSDWSRIQDYDYYPTIEVFVANTATPDAQVFTNETKITSDFDTGGAMYNKTTSEGRKCTNFQFSEEIANSLNIPIEPDDVVDVGCYRVECKIGLKSQSTSTKIAQVEAHFLTSEEWEMRIARYNPQRKAFITRDLFYLFSDLKILLEIRPRKTTILSA